LGVLPSQRAESICLKTGVRAGLGQKVEGSGVSLLVMQSSEITPWLVPPFPSVAPRKRWCAYENLNFSHALGSYKCRENPDPRKWTGKASMQTLVPLGLRPHVLLYHCRFRFRSEGERQHRLSSATDCPGPVSPRTSGVLALKCKM